MATLCHGGKLVLLADAGFDPQDRNGGEGVSDVSEEASYVCDACGEEIVIPVDLSAGENQEYVEDCPVCCRPNIIHLEIEEGGEVRVWAEAE